MATDILLKTRLIVPTVNQYFPIMLLVSHWFPGKIYRGKQCLQYIITLVFQGELFIPTYYGESAQFTEPIPNSNFQWWVFLLLLLFKDRINF